MVEIVVGNVRVRREVAAKWLAAVDCRGEMRRAHLASLAGIVKVDGYVTYNRPVRSAGADEKMMDSTSSRRRLRGSGQLEAPS